MYLSLISARQKSLSLPRKPGAEPLTSYTHKVSNFDKGGDRSASLNKNANKFDKVVRMIISMFIAISSKLMILRRKRALVFSNTINLTRMYQARREKLKLIILMEISQCLMYL